MRIIKQYKYWIIGIIVIMLFATLWDFQISSAVVPLKSKFIVMIYYRFFEIFGEFAVMLSFVLLFGFFLNFGLRKKKSLSKYIQVVGNGIGLIIATTLQFIAISGYLFPEGGNSNGTITPLMIMISFLLGLFYAFFITKIMSLIKDENYRYYRKVALVGILYIVLVVLIVNGIKVIWARPRYWLIESGKSYFVPWYVINGTGQTSVSNAYMSFVSGHTANAFVAAYISMWSLNNRKWWFNLGMTWGLCVALSRILAGQHFLSDSVMGGVISFALLIIISTLFKLDQKPSNSEKGENETEDVASSHLV